MSAEELVQAVLDAVDVCEMAIVGLSHLTGGEYDFSSRGPARVGAEQRLERVRAALDLLDASALDRAKVQDGAVCGAHLRR